MAREDMMVMRRKELTRLHVVRKVIQDELTQVEAARMLGVSERQVRRCVRRVEGEGERGVIHRSRGRRSNRAYEETLKRRVVKLYGDKYAGFGHLMHMVLISERPAEVNDRAVPGHWEGDLILGKRSQSAIGTLVERQTRFVMLLSLSEGRLAEHVRDALAGKIAGLPEHLRRSLTWDRGKEMSEHVQFTIDTGVQVYFCDPRSPWQRATSENSNGLLRQYFPKGVGLSVYNQERLDQIAAELNGRPRKTLNWLTPSEAFVRAVAMTA